MRNMTFDEFNVLFDEAESKVVLENNDFVSVKKSNGMSVSLAAFLDSLADPVKRELVVNEVVSKLSSTK